jgi:hypothetical protein
MSLFYHNITASVTMVVKILVRLIYLTILWMSPTIAGLIGGWKYAQGRLVCDQSCKKRLIFNFA